MVGLLFFTICVVTRSHAKMRLEFSCIHNAIPKQSGLWIEFKP